jgi:capsular exopolysaccharide synthesis family protein
MSERKERLALPSPESSGPVPAIAERFTVQQPAFTYAEPDAEEQALPLSHYLWILKRRRWEILAFVLTSVIATVVISSRLTPIYESTATINIDREIQANIVGKDSDMQASNYDAEQFLATQIKLIQSDSVLRPVVQRLKLEAPAKANPRDPQIPTTRAEDAPIGLRYLKVTRPPNTYLLLISYRSPDPQLAAEAANQIADSYKRHSYDIRYAAAQDQSKYLEKQLDALKATMERSSLKLAQFEKDLKVIDPEQKTSILTTRLVQLSTEFTNAQTERFRKEAAFNAVKSGSLEAAEASTQGDQLRKLADNLGEAQQNFEAVKLHQGAAHPVYIKAAAAVAELGGQLDALKDNIVQRVGTEYQQALEREAQLGKALEESKDESDKLNASSFEYKAVKQEADSDKTLYDEMWRKIQEAEINASFQNSSIRLADPARPSFGPVFPNTPLNAVLALLFSSMLAVGGAVLVDVLDNTISDPEQIQRGMKTDVLGSLPVVKAWRGRLTGPARGKDGKSGRTGRTEQASSFDEAIRTLRDSILLSDPIRRPHTLLVTSAVPREGKTTTSTRLAIAHSLQLRKTLLIDADLRRPGVHDRFGLKNEIGLSSVVHGKSEWRQAVQHVEDYPDLAVLPAGPASRRAADRVGAVLEEILEEAKQEYDLIIVDAPPLLGFAEPLQMAAIVDGVVVITLAGQTSRTAVASVLNNLKRLKANVIGVALNEVREDMSDRYYYYGYYGKYYSKYYKPTDES